MCCWHCYLFTARTHLLSQSESPNRYQLGTGFVFGFYLSLYSLHEICIFIHTPVFYMPWHVVEAYSKVGEVVIVDNTKQD
jgi:hypothetical protein